MSASSTLSLRPLHVATEQDAPLVVEQLEGESVDHFAKRTASIHALGVRYTRHPLYVPLLRHSTNPELSAEGRREYLEGIARAAAESRSKNKAFHRTVAVRKALGGS